MPGGRSASFAASGVSIMTHATRRLGAHGMGFLVVAAFLLLRTPAPALAIIVEGPSCLTCQGGTYTLTSDGIDYNSDPLLETFRITLSIDTRALDIPGVAFLDAAAIKVSSSVVASALVDAPGGVSNWTLAPGGVNAGGCSGKGGGFDCADWVRDNGAPVGGIVSFVFDQTVNPGALFPGLEGASLKVRYLDARGHKVGDLVSESVTPGPEPSPPVPEPSTLLLAASGFATWGVMAWRRHRRG